MPGAPWVPGTTHEVWEIGSRKPVYSCFGPRDHAPVAQRIEHLTTDQKVGGSNPSGRASLKVSLRFAGWRFFVFACLLVSREYSLLAYTADVQNGGEGHLMTKVPDVEFHTEGLPWWSLPARFPHPDYRSPTEAAGSVLNHFHHREDLGPIKTSYGAKLSSILEANRFGNYSGIYLWTTEPILPHALVTVELRAAEGDVDATHRRLAGVADDATNHGASVTFPGLGRGTVFEQTRMVRKGLFGKAPRWSVKWTWRLDEADLMVTFERDDEESLARIRPDVEVLLAAVTVGD